MIRETTTVGRHKSAGRYFFRTAIPRSIGTNLLGLGNDIKNQKLLWEAENGRVFVRRR